MSHEVLKERVAYEGAVVDVRVDTVRMPDGSRVEREVVAHADSVAVVALDPDGRVLLIHQYRHPLRTELWELPAGLRDEEGESAEATARRELREEAGVEAGSWTVLVELHPTPGMTDEAVTVYLATDLSFPGRPQAGAGAGGEAEEAALEQRWLSVPEACEEVFQARITNGHTVAGILALAVRGSAGPTGPKLSGS
jgi:8-oxo-dGTP pyrophosphatase MutT (NUDIX family)